MLYDQNKKTTKAYVPIKVRSYNYETSRYMNVIWSMNLHMLHDAYYVSMFILCLWNIDKSYMLTMKDLSSIGTHTS